MDDVEALLTNGTQDPTALAARLGHWAAARAMQLPALTPEVWAAAMAYLALRPAEPERAAELACAEFGVPRRQLERAIFLLEAGQRLKPQ